jgi:hypothetical protein
MQELERQVYGVIRVLEAQPTPLPSDTEGVHFQYAPVPYRDAARAVAQALDNDAFWRLIPMYDVRPGPPEDYRPQERGKVSRSFAWETQWFTTLSEILYQARGKAVPALRAAAFADGSGSGAIGRVAALEVYAHLASDGVETDRFVTDVRDAFPELDRDARMSVVEVVSSYGRRNSARRSDFEKIEALPGYQEARKTWLSSGAE